MKKKICFVTTIAASLRTFLLKTAEALYETGEFEIYFMANPDAEIEKEFPEFVHFIPVKMKRGIDAELIKVILNMKKIFKKEKFDVVQYFTPNASFYASTASRLAKIPNRVYTQWGMVYVGFSGIKRKIFKLLEKTTCANSTYIEVENRANLRFSHSEGLYPESKGVVIGNGSAAGVSLERYDVSKKDEFRASVRAEHQIPEENFVFGFMGRVTRDKGVNELLTAAQKMIEEHQDVTFLIAGALSDTNVLTLNPQLYAWAQECPNVILAGRTPVPEQYYAAMDCYVMPSYREGFGMTIIEAQGMKTPVIISDITGHEDTMLPDVTGLCVPVRSSDALFDAMNTMYADKEKCALMGAKGREYVENNFEQKKLIGLIVEARKNLIKNN
ncbi:MAG: glycosyltransferase [Clostridia bacterium]|nr:glycosyltransferase [Clostridia bacterium]